MYEKDLVLNDLQWLICYKTKAKPKQKLTAKYVNNGKQKHSASKNEHGVMAKMMNFRPRS